MSASSESGRSPGSFGPILVAASIAVFLGLAELPFAALMADDLMQVSILERVSPCTWTGPLDLYTLSDGVPEHVHAMQNAGAFPWFSPPDFKMAFFRPLSSALLVLDHALWGLQPVGYRAHGGCWFVVLVVAVGLVLRRLLPGPAGVLALIVFTVSAIHGSLFWNATRHVVIAGALGMLGLAAHVEWREAGWRAGRVLALLALASSLAASEAGLAGFGYLLAYEALAAPGDGRARRRAVAPALVLLGVYVVAYDVAGLGARGGGYVNPLESPVAFLAILPGAWLFLQGALVAGGSADLWLLRPDLQPAFALIGGALVLGFAWLLRATWASSSADERRAGRWAIAGTAASVVPFAGTPIGSRCLVLPMVGGAVAIALVLQHWWTGPRRSRAVSAACITLAVIHLVVAPVGRLAAPYVLRRMLYDRVATAMEQVDLDAATLARRRVVVLRAPDFVLGLHPFFFRVLHRLPMARSWRTLSWAAARHRYTRTDSRTLVLDLIDGQLEGPTFAVGDTIVLDGLSATVMARNDAGPIRIRFDFDRPLDDPDLVFLTWRSDRLQPAIVPPIGEALEP